MRKLFKKALACCLVAAMALTCFVGALTVNAEDAAGTIVASSVEVAADATSVEVPVAITSTAAINAAKINVAADGYDVTDVIVAEGDSYIDADEDGSNKDINGGTFLLQAKKNDVGFTAAALTVVLAPKDGIVEADIVITLEDVHAATWEEEVVVLTPNTDAKITVKADEPEVIEPVVDSAIQLGRGILAREKMGVRFTTIVANYSAYDSYYLEVKSQHFEVVDGVAYTLTNATDKFVYVANGEETPEGFNKQADSTDKYHYFDYSNITAYELALPMDVTIYCIKDGAVVAKSQTWSFSIASRILSSQLTNSASDAAYVDLVNYGTAVQQHFAAENPDSDLAAFTAETLANDGFEAFQKYATADSVTNAATAVNSNKGTAVTGYNAAIGKGLQIQASNQLYFMIAPSSYDVSKLTVKYNYVDSYGTDKSLEVPVTDLVLSGKYYYLYLSSDNNVALYDTGVVVSAELYLDDTLIYTREYSVESFVAESMQSGTAKNVGDALMKFTYSLRKNLKLD